MRQALPGPLGIMWRNSYDRTNVRGSRRRARRSARSARASTLNDPLKREQSILAQENQAITTADRLAAAQGRTFANEQLNRTDIQRLMRRRDVQKRQDQISKQTEPFSNAAIAAREKLASEQAEDNTRLALPTPSDTTSKNVEPPGQSQRIEAAYERRQRRRYRRGIGPRPPRRSASEIPDRAKALPLP